MKILHLVDDHQVVERSLSRYELLFPNNNDVLIFSESQQLKHISRYKACTIVNSSNFQKVVNEYDFTDVGCVVAHYMSFIKIDFIRLLPEYIPICWAIYGGDLYIQFADVIHLPLYYSKPERYLKYSLFRTYLPETYNLLLYLKSGNRHLLRCHRKRDFQYICSRVNSLSGAECDMNILEEASQKTFIKRFGNVYPLKETLQDLYDSGFSSGGDIMIGNSASFSNNHLYALRLLKRVSIPDSHNIRLTLSYGGSDKYIRVVTNGYKSVYGDQVKIIDGYMPLDEYNKMFMDVSVMILPAWRQESFGTILMGLYLGIKVYLSRKNPLYTMLINKGFKVYCIEDIDNKSLLTSFTYEEKVYNRRMVKSVYDSSPAEELEEYIRKILNSNKI